MRSKLLLGVFALPFLGVGVWMFCSIGAMALDAWQMRAWVPVSAQLVTAGYQSRHGDDSTTFEAHAEFRYAVDGTQYSGTRVTLGKGADNLGNYQRALGRRLRETLSRGEPVTVYVNPARASEAIVDRGLRWELVGFKSIFVFAFGGAGLGMLFVARRKSPQPASETTVANAPWLANDDWQAPSIASDSRTAMWGAWLFAALWNTISAVLPFVAWREVVDKGNYLALIALMFPAIGIGLLYWAVRRTREWRRFRMASVQLDPFPASISIETYDIPVYATASRSTQVTDRKLATSRQQYAAQVENSLRQRFRTDPYAAGRQLLFPMGRHFETSIIGFIIGSVFAAAGGFFLVKESSWLFGGVFGIVGAVIALASLFRTLNSLEVRRDGTSIFSVRRLLGVPIRRRRMAQHDVTALRKICSMKVRSGNKHTLYFSIIAYDNFGNELTVGEGFQGESEADAAIQFIAQEFGLQTGEEERRNKDVVTIRDDNILTTD